MIERRKDIVEEETWFSIRLKRIIKPHINTKPSICLPEKLCQQIKRVSQGNAELIFRHFPSMHMDIHYPAYLHSLGIIPITQDLQIMSFLITPFISLSLPLHPFP